MKKNHAYRWIYTNPSVTKLLKIMKLVSILLFICALSVHAGGFSQDVKVNLSLNGVKLTKFFKAIEKETKFRFAFSNDIIPDGRIVTINVKQALLSQVMNDVISLTNLKYRFDEKSGIFIISEKSNVPLRDTYAAVVRTITGNVTNEKGEPLAEVSVQVKGSTKATITSANGSFSIDVEDNAKALIFSFVGMVTREVSIEGKSAVQVVLQLSNKTLDDVVVVGYGSAKKKDVTGAVSSISSKDFNEGTILNPIQQIQGKVPGLVITAPSGDPNANPTIRLRGQTSLAGGQNPLIVVDGIPLDDVNQLSNIAAGDIASYDVLKDASATSIFGSRGANGVIMVTTKKGKAGQSKIEYNTFVGIDKQPRFLDLLSGDEWRKANPIAVGGRYDDGANTDWQRAITRTAYSHSHTLAMSGGANGFNYRGSVSYLNQEGIISNSGKDQINIRFSGQQKALNDKLELNLGVVASQTNRKFVAGFTNERLSSTSPGLSVYNPDGSYNTFNFSVGEQNAVQALDQTTNSGKEYLIQLFGTIDYEIVKNLKVGALGAFTNFNSTSRFFLPVNINGNPVNEASRNSGTRDNARGDFHINYSNTWGKHNLNLTGVYEYNYFTSDGFSANGRDYPISFFQDNNLGTGDPTRNSISSGKEEFKLISFLGRANYNYDNKYYLTASMRRDGSSKFGKNNRWGTFPAVNVAWRISKENFLKDVSWINDIKIRVGYGETGNSDAISPYASFLSYGPIGSNVYNPVTGTFITAYGPNQNANPDLRWEKRIGQNIGLDFSLFNNRLSGDFNIFNDRTENLLFNYTLPSPPFFILPPNGSGPEAARVLANVGSLTNKGMELSLNYLIVDKKDFSWTFGGQISHVKTRVTRLAGNYAGFNIKDTTAIAGFSTDANGNAVNPTTFLKAGYAPYVFFLPRFQGLDADGKQLIDTAKNFIDPSPLFTYGFTNTFRYKNWSLNVFFRGVYGQKAYNNQMALLESNSAARLQRGYNITQSALTNGIKDGQRLSDKWLENASYLRLDNASLGYTFLNVKGIQNLRVYVATNNLFVITPYRGLDPEIDVANQNSAFISFGSQTSKTRSVSFGLNVTF